MFEEGAWQEDEARAPVDPAELLAKMHEGIGRLLRDAAVRNSTTLDGIHHRALTQDGPIEAPHPEESWRYRSRKVFERLREHKLVWSLPWHHRETWFWVASTSDGVDWVEREIRYWENKVERHERQRARQKKLAEDLPRIEYVYTEGDEFLFLEEDEDLKERVEEIVGRG